MGGVVVWILPVRHWSVAEGVSKVAVDYNANNFGRRVTIARLKRTLGGATPEDGNRVLIRMLGASSEGMR